VVSFNLGHSVVFTARCYVERGSATVSRLSVRLSVTLRYTVITKVGNLQK